MYQPPVASEFSEMKRNRYCVPSFCWNASLLPTHRFQTGSYMTRGSNSAHCEVPEAPHPVVYPANELSVFCISSAEDAQLVRRIHHRMRGDRKSTRLNSSHRCISYAVFCLKKKK